MGFNSGFKGLNSAVHCPRWFLSMGPRGGCIACGGGQGGFRCDEDVYPSNLAMTFNQLNVTLYVHSMQHDYNQELTMNVKFTL